MFLRRIYFILFIHILVIIGARGQSENTVHQLQSFLKEGDFSFHGRTYVMSTFNKGELSNYAAIAGGAGLRYQTPSFFHFNAGMSGFFSFRLYSYHLKRADPVTGGSSRYEVALFDMNNPINQTEMDRLEELFIQYDNGTWQFTLGRQKINTPLLNEQDSRMMPNVFTGLTGHWQKKGFMAEAGWLTTVSPRGTVNWYPIEESFGVYSFGRNTFGSPSEYKGNMSSLGIGYAGLQYTSPQVDYQLWEYYANNVFSITMGQVDANIPLASTNILLGLQGFYQRATHHGGNPDAAKTYILPRDQTYGIGGLVGLEKGPHQLSLNAMAISKKGRFVFPREWGREQFYASLPRERFEGNGGLNALTLKYRYTTTSGFSADLGAGGVNTPDIQNTRLNKYGMPSYLHLTGAVQHQFSGWLNGLEGRLIVVHKTAKNGNALPDTFRINRVDMWNINFIVDYRF